MHASTSSAGNNRIAAVHCTRRASAWRPDPPALRPATRSTRNSAIASRVRLARFLLSARAVRTTYGLVLLLSACAITGEGSSPDDLTSVDGNQAVIDFDGFV